MKRTLIVALMMLLTTFAARAQFGVIGGLTSMASDYKDALGNVKDVNLYHVGLTYEINLGAIAIQPSVIYNMKGSSIGTLSKESLTNIEYRTGYVEVPVMVQYGIAVGRVARVFGFAEPYISYAVTNYSKDVTSDDFVSNIEAIRDKLGYGVGAGIGAEITKHFQLTVRYVWDLGQSGFNNALNVVQENPCNCIRASLAFMF